MFKSHKNCLLALFIFGILFLSACKGSQTPIEKMYEVLESAVTAEKVFVEQQALLVNLETKEKDVYDQILSAGMKNVKKVTDLADQADAIADKRAEHLEKEKASISKSKKEFQKIAPIIEELDNPSLKSESRKLYDLMNERYKIYDEIYLNYSKALKLDHELYTMFKDENIQIKQLEEQIKRINDIYNKILIANDKFNKKTKEYNDAKRSFYKNAGLLNKD